MRTLTDIDADILAVEQKKIRPATDLLLDPHGTAGLGGPALERLRAYEAQLCDLRCERAAVVAASYVPPAPAISTEQAPGLTTTQISDLTSTDLGGLS